MNEEKPKNKKPVFKILLGIAGAIILLLIFYNMGKGNNNSNTGTNTTTDTVQQTVTSTQNTPTSDTTVAPTKSKYQIGDTIDQNNILVTINGVRTGTSDGYSDVEAGFKYVYVDITIFLIRYPF